MSTLPCLTYTQLYNRQLKEMIGIKFRNRELKLSLSAIDMIAYIESPM